MHILLTGDYCHDDFAALISNDRCALTLRRLEQVVEDVDSLHLFDLILIAQARPGQFDNSILQRLIVSVVNVPVLAVCGSWCEGEVRTGSPEPGLFRLYWHQWQGCFENFVDCLARHRVSGLRLPKISTVADQIMIDCQPQYLPEHRFKLGVSSLHREGFELIRDSMPGTEMTWIENEGSGGIRMDSFHVILVEANSFSASTEQRIRSVQQLVPQMPMLLTLNYPRRYELIRAASLGVRQVVSKPFKITDLMVTVRNVAIPFAA